MITTTNRKDEYPGAGIVLVANSTFKAFDVDDVVVVERDDTTGLRSVLTKDTHYTIVIGSPLPAGVTVTSVAPVAVGKTWVLYRAAPLTQEVDYESFGKFPAASHEQALDRLVMLAQELESYRQRSVHIGIDDENPGDFEIPNKVDRLGLFLKFDEITGDPVCVAIATDTISASLLSKSLLNNSTPAGWRAGLGVPLNIKDWDQLDVDDFSARPTPGLFGDRGWFFAKDQRRLAWTDEVNWFEVGFEPFAFSQLPAAGNLNRLYLDTDRRRLLRDDGAALVDLEGPWPRGHHAGFKLSVSSASFTIQAGEARFRTSGDASVANGRRATSITKLIGAGQNPWFEGNGNAGRASAAAWVPGGWYHVFLIMKGDGTIDAGADTSPTAANLMSEAASSGYLYYFRAGSVRADGGPTNLIPLVHMGRNRFLWTEPGLDYDARSGGAHAQLGAASTPVLLSIPPDFQVQAIFNALLNNGASTGAVVFSSPSVTDQPPMLTLPGAAGDIVANLQVSNNDNSAGRFEVLSNTSRQIRARANATMAQVGISTIGWEDFIDP